MNQWQIGKIRVTRIMEMELAGGTRFILPEATREACLPLEWLRPHFMDAQGNLIMSVHALVVDTGDRRIIVDTCIGNDKQRSIPAWSNLQTSFLQDLDSAGYPRESIDTVLCTHLHVDHVGWNTMLVDNQWVPTFPNARYLLAEKEWRHWDSVGGDPMNAELLNDSVRPVLAAGLVDLVDWEHEVCEGVRLAPTPGHTPGHVSIHIESGGEKALITGDWIHHPCQMTRTDWCSSADHDQHQARATRETLLENYTDKPVLIIGTHFATPTAGRVKRLPQGGYWFDVDLPAS
ncbi:MAG: MBL fold metallo-hydrolase [Gammaproteobacteria bacterium]|nr:MBL fold metallo-hydrolase [Gammaproteobacteria bacterium]